MSQFSSSSSSSFSHARTMPALPPSSASWQPEQVVRIHHGAAARTDPLPLSHRVVEVRTGRSDDVKSASTVRPAEIASLDPDEGLVAPGMGRDAPPASSDAKRSEPWWAGVHDDDAPPTPLPLALYVSPAPARPLAARVIGVIPHRDHDRSGWSRPQWLAAATAMLSTVGVMGLVEWRDHVVEGNPFMLMPDVVLAIGLPVLAGLVSGWRDDDRADGQDRQLETKVLGRGLGHREMLEHLLLQANRYRLSQRGLQTAIDHLRQVPVHPEHLPGRAVAQAVARLGAHALVWARRPSRTDDGLADTRFLTHQILQLAADGICTWPEAADAVVRLAHQYNRAHIAPGAVPAIDGLPQVFLNALQAAQARSAGTLTPQEASRHALGLVHARFMDTGEPILQVIDTAAAAMPAFAAEAPVLPGLGPEPVPVPTLAALPQGLDAAPNGVKALYAGLRVVHGRSDLKLGSTFVREVLARVRQAEQPAGGWTADSARVCFAHLPLLAGAMGELTDPAFQLLLDFMQGPPAGACADATLSFALGEVGKQRARQMTAPQATALARAIVQAHDDYDDAASPATRQRHAADRIAQAARGWCFEAQAAAFDEMPRDPTGRQYACIPMADVAAAFARLDPQAMQQHLPTLREMVAAHPAGLPQARAWVQVVDTLAPLRPTAQPVLREGLLPLDEVERLLQDVMAQAPAEGQEDGRHALIPRLVQLPQERATATLLQATWDALKDLPRFQPRAGEGERARGARHDALTLACIEARQRVAQRLIPESRPKGQDNRIPHAWLASLPTPKAHEQLHEDPEQDLPAAPLAPAAYLAGVAAHPAAAGAPA